MAVYRSVAAKSVPKVRPSGAARASAAAARLPAAPGRFSTTIGWPSSGSSRCARIRVRRSGAPPAGKPTIHRSGRSGQDAAFPEGRGRGQRSGRAMSARRVASKQIQVSGERNGVSLYLAGDRAQHMVPQGIRSGKAERVRAACSIARAPSRFAKRALTQLAVAHAAERQRGHAAAGSDNVMPTTSDRHHAATGGTVGSAGSCPRSHRMQPVAAEGSPIADRGHTSRLNFGTWRTQALWQVRGHATLVPSRRTRSSMRMPVIGAGLFILLAGLTQVLTPAPRSPALTGR